MLFAYRIKFLSHVLIVKIRPFVRVAYRILACELRQVAVAFHSLQLMGGEEYLPLVRQLVESSDVLFRTSVLVHTDNQQVIEVHSFRPAIPFRGRFIFRMIVKEMYLHLPVQKSYRIPVMGDCPLCPPLVAQGVFRMLYKSNLRFFQIELQML